MGKQPSYFPSFLGPKIAQTDQFDQTEHEKWLGKVTAFESHVTHADFVQPREFWKDLGKEEGQQKNFVGNVSSVLSLVKEDIRKETYSMLDIS